MTNELLDINIDLINEMKLKGGIMRFEAQRLLDAYHQDLKQQRKQNRKEQKTIQAKKYRLRMERRENNGNN